MKPEAIFLDLDDTIISFDSSCNEAWSITAGKYIEDEHPGFDKDDLLRVMNKTRSGFWSDPHNHKWGRLNIEQARRIIMKQSLNELNIDDEIKSNHYADYYTKLQDELISIFPNSISSLERFRRLSIPMVLITNGTSKTQRSKIERFNLSGFFDKIIIEEEFDSGKPDVRVFQHALDFVRVNPEKVWMVGDNLVWDVQAPQRLGIFSIWNDYRKKGLPENSEIIPDKIIHEIAELCQELCLRQIFTGFSDI